MDYYSLFWGPGVISGLMIPGVRLRVSHQHLQFWPILARFVDYYSSYCGADEIFRIFKHLSAFTRHSSTLDVFADYGLLRGLLLTVLGS